MIHSALVPASLVFGFVTCLRSWGRCNPQHIHIHTPIPVFPPRRLFLATRSPPLRLPVVRLPARPPPLLAHPAGHLLFFVSSLRTLWTPFSITTVPMARSLLHSTSCLMRRTRTRSNNVRSNKRRMAPDPFLRPSDGSVDVRARAFPHRQITPRHLNDSPWRRRRSYVSSAASPAQPRHPPNPSSKSRHHNPSQYHPLLRKSRAGGNCLSGRAPGRRPLPPDLILTAHVPVRRLALRARRM